MVGRRTWTRCWLATKWTFRNLAYVNTVLRLLRIPAHTRVGSFSVFSPLSTWLAWLCFFDGGCTAYLSTCSRPTCVLPPLLQMEPSRGRALADKFGIRFFETSAKSGSNVKKVFTTITRDIVRRMEGQQTGAAPAAGDGKKGSKKGSKGKGGRHGKKCVIM
mgnify:CR=1 FL=1